tara:strand:- start:5698 stop:6459 length:762 start_codon:yes stop_codon:yes gene_type:complete
LSELIKIASWYSGGIDAVAYAANEIGGFEVSYHIESDSRAYKYLKKNYPNCKIIIHDESSEIKRQEWVHIIAGGDPCQPSSNAGLRRGKSDDRYRWPAMFKGIKNRRPDFVINENVVGSISNMVLDQKITDLESIGYTCQAYIIPAVSVDTDHTRRRVFLIAYSNVQRWREPLQGYPDYSSITSRQTDALAKQRNPFLRFEERTGESAILSMDDEIPDHIPRLGFAGNSIVPDIIMIFLASIKEMYNQGILLK